MKSLRGLKNKTTDKDLARGATETCQVCLFVLQTLKYKT